MGNLSIMPIGDLYSVPYFVKEISYYLLKDLEESAFIDLLKSSKNPFIVSTSLKGTKLKLMPEIDSSGVLNTFSTNYDNGYYPLVNIYFPDKNVYCAFNSNSEYNLAFYTVPYWKTIKRLYNDLHNSGLSDVNIIKLLRKYISVPLLYPITSTASHNEKIYADVVKKYGRVELNNSLQIYSALQLLYGYSGVGRLLELKIDIQLIFQIDEYGLPSSVSYDAEDEIDMERLAKDLLVYLNLRNIPLSGCENGDTISVDFPGILIKDLILDEELSDADIRNVLKHITEMYCYIHKDEIDYLKQYDADFGFILRGNL